MSSLELGSVDRKGSDDLSSSKKMDRIPQEEINVDSSSSLSPSSSASAKFKFKSTTIKHKGVKIIVPNGGFGWVVVMAGFFVQVLVVGTMNSFGVFFPIYIDYFKQPASSVTWIGSIMNAFATGKS